MEAARNACPVKMEPILMGAKTGQEFFTILGDLLMRKDVDWFKSSEDKKKDGGANWKSTPVPIS